MKQILEQMQITKQSCDEERLQILREVGINKGEIKRQIALKEGFIVITLDKIIKFICDEMRRRNPFPKDLEISDIRIYEKEISCGGMNHRDRLWFVMRWVELDLKEVTHNFVPPMNLLTRLRNLQQRNMFDYYTVATVNYEQVKLPDPFLLGRLNNVSDRFFIGQWGDDINVDNVI